MDGHPASRWPASCCIQSSARRTDVQDSFQDYLLLSYAALDGSTSFLSSADPYHLAQLAALSPHCTYIVDCIHDARTSFTSPEHWELMASKLTCTVAQFARITQAYAFSEAMFHHALVIRLRYLGASHPEVLAVRHELAQLHWERDQTRRSIDEYAALLEDCRESLDDHDPLVAMCQLDLAVVRSHFSDATTIVDDFRAVVRLSWQLHEQTDAVGLSAQMNLVKELWDRGDGSCTAEQFKLLSMLQEVDDAGDAVPMELQRLRGSIGQLVKTYFGWCEYLDPMGGQARGDEEPGQQS